MGSGKVSGIWKSRYSLTSVSRSSLPSSTCCITAVQVKSLEIEPIRKSVVAGSTALLESTTAYPYPFEKRSAPSRTTETVMPATW